MCVCICYAAVWMTLNDKILVQQVLIAKALKRWALDANDSDCVLYFILFSLARLHFSFFLSLFFFFFKFFSRLFGQFLHSTFHVRPTILFFSSSFASSYYFCFCCTWDSVCLGRNRRSSSVSVCANVHDA